MAVPSFLIDTSAGETPQSIAKKRAIIQQLMMPYGKASNIGEGVGQLFNGIAVGMQGRKLDKAESAGMAAGSTAKANILRALTGSAPIGEGAFPPAPKAPAQSAGVPSATGLDVAKKLQQDFGLTPEAAAGFAGNLAHESGNFKTLQEINPTVKGSRGGFGWAQWTGPRRRQFEAFAAQNGLDPTSPEANYGFLKTELQGPEGRVLKALQGVNDPNKAAQIVSDTFLRPGIPHMGSRMSKAQAIMQALQGGGDTGIQANPQGMAIPDAGIQAMPQGARNPDPGIEVASLDPSIGMPQQMYVGQVNPNGSIGTTTQPAPQQPIPQQAPQPQQVAQAAPQATQGQGMAIQDAGTPFERMAPQQGGMNLEMLIQQAQNPWLDDQSKAMVNSMIEREMQKQDPAYQLQQQQAQIGLQKDQLELKNLQNPQPKWDVVTGKDGSIFRVNPQTGEHETIYGPQAEPVKPTADIQEYEYAKGQGFQGTFQDFQLAVKKAGASQVNIDQKAEGQFDKTLAEKQASSFDAMATDGMNAKADLAVIGQLDGLLQGQGGTLTGLSGALAKYGIGGEGVGDLQAADALINKLIPSQRQAGSGSMSDRDVEMFKASLPSLWKTPDGNKTILNTMTGLAQYKQAQGDIAQRVMIGEIDRQTAVKLLRELPNPLAAFGEKDKKPAPNADSAANIKSKYGLE